MPQSNTRYVVVGITPDARVVMDRVYENKTQADMRLAELSQLVMAQKGAYWYMVPALYRWEIHQTEAWP